MRLDFNRDDGTQNDLSMIIRIGEVTTVDAAAHKASVTFDDDDGVTSGMLPVLIPNSLENRDHCLPDIGEDVLCLFLPTGTEEGFILGSIYAGNVSTPETSADVRSVTFADETRIAYDRSGHKLSATVKGDVELKADGKVSVEAQDEVSIKSSSKIVLTAPQIVFNGPINTYSQSGGDGVMTVQGTMHATGDVTASGISLNSHKHDGVQSGGSKTGGPT